MKRGKPGGRSSRASLLLEPDRSAPGRSVDGELADRVASVCTERGSSAQSDAPREGIIEQPRPLGQVVEELSGPLLRYLGRYVGDRDLADDLLQETLIRIARGLPGFAGRSEMKTWAFSIATRVAADHFRKPANRVQIVDVAESPELPVIGDSVEQQLVVDEMNACVRQVIDSLPEEYRAALVLHDLEGLTAMETAEVCGSSVPTAKIRIHRARMRLKEALREECVFYRDSENVLRCDRKD